jgi:hypothetical protein
VHRSLRAAALWLRQRRSGTQSVLGGVAVGVLAFALVYLHAGSASLPAVPLMLIVIAVEFPVALTLRSVSVRRSVPLRI